MKKLIGLTLALMLLIVTSVLITDVFAQEYIQTVTLTGHTGVVDTIVFADSQTLISGSWDNTLRAWNVHTGEQLWSRDVADRVYAVAVPAHNPFFVAYGGYEDHDIRMRYTNDGTWRGSLGGHTSSVHDLAFKPGSYLLASASGDGTIRIWDVANRDNPRLVRILSSNQNVPVTSLAWSPDGRILATANQQSDILLWDPNTGVNFAELPRNHRGRVGSLAFSPNGELLASGSHDRTIRIWDMETLDTLRVLKGHRYWISTLAFHPNREILATRSGPAGYIYLWNPNTGGRKFALTGHGGAVRSLVFSPDGELLAASGDDGPIHVGRLLTMDIPVDIMDVTGNGSVTVWDLVEVAADLGEIVPMGTKTDINNDGVVDIEDLRLVARALGADAAPALNQNPTEFPFTYEDAQQWIHTAQQMGADAYTIAVLEQILAAVTQTETPPKETAVLPNYPNPFNPETWIPYQLAKPADVCVTIHSASGTLVRTLHLGHQAVGIYESRNRAAYWDGRNALGEPVASGVYFYTLTAGDFTATRKMLIRK